MIDGIPEEQTTFSKDEKLGLTIWTHSVACTFAMFIAFEEFET